MSAAGNMRRRADASMSVDTVDNGATMTLRVDLPASTLYEGAITAIQASAENGSFGLWPRHADFVTSLVPGVVVVTDDAGEEIFLGVDHGLLVKRGRSVNIAVRRGAISESLERLTEIIETTFMTVDEQERVARTALSRLEVNIVRQLSQLSDPIT